MSARQAKRQPNAQAAMTEPTKAELRAAINGKSPKAMSVVGSKLGLPLWVLMIPGAAASGAGDPENGLQAIVDLVQNFIGRNSEGKPLRAADRKPTPGDLPTAATLDDRLEVQRRRLFKSGGIVGTVQQTLKRGRSPIDGTLSQDTAAQCDWALRGVLDELDSIAGNWTRSACWRCRRTRPTLQPLLGRT